MGSVRLRECVDLSRDETNRLFAVSIGHAKAEVRKYLVEQLKDRATNEDDARPMEFFDLTTKDRATFNVNLKGLREATTRMTSGHPIGIIDPSQLEGSNEFADCELRMP